MAINSPWPLMAPKSTELRLMHFDDYVYTATPDTVLYKLVDALCGTTGAGALVNQIFLARMAGALETIYYNDLDFIFGKISFLARSPAESYSYNPMMDLLTSDQWDEVRTKDAWYRARIKDFFVACGLGGTPDGVRMCVQAALAVDCDIYEVYRYLDTFGLNESLGRSPHPARNELVIRPHKGSLQSAELRLVRDMLAKICPMDTIVTVTTHGLAVQSPIPVNAAASDSEYFEVQKMVTATPAMANMPPPDLLPIDLLPTETWLYEAQTDPTLAPYAAFNISSEYGYYYLVGGGRRSPIDSVTYGTINLNAVAKVTVYEMSGSFQVDGVTTMTSPPNSWFATNLDPSRFRWISVPYPIDQYPMSSAVSTGVGNLTNLITGTPGPFVLVGYGMGAHIISDVYDQIRNGSLTNRAGDFLAGLAFGNPRRQSQITFPQCPDPGGHGLDANNLLTASGDNWWEFAVPGDLVTIDGDDEVGAEESTIFETLYTDYVGDLTTVSAELWQVPAAMLRLQNQVDLFYGYPNSTQPHFQYTSYRPVPGDVRSCVQIAADRISSLENTTTIAGATSDTLETLPVICYEVGETNVSRFPSWFATNLDPRIRYIWVPYPALTQLPLSEAVDAGVANLITLINQNSGKFVLVGTGEGAIVTSLVYDQIRSGSLQYRRDDLLAGVAFGNPRRQVSTIFPGGVDPGGHGISSNRLTGTESLWWEFANANDILTTTASDSAGALTTSVFEAFMADYIGTISTVTSQFSNTATVNVSQLLQGIINVMFGEGGDTPHALYGSTAPLTGDTRSSWQVARDYLNTFAGRGTPVPAPVVDPMTTYQPAPNYQVFDTVGKYTSPIPYEKADSADNYPGGKYGIHPESAPALNPDGTPYIFAYTSQSAYISQKVIQVLAQGGLANADNYQLPLSAPSSSARVFYPEYAIAYYPPAKDSTVSMSITGTHGAPNQQITTEARDPVNFVRSN